MTFIPVPKAGSDKLVTMDQFRKRMERVAVDKFKEVNRRLFAQQMTNPTWGLNDVDLRLLVRQFLMGWAESAAARGDDIYCHCWAEVFGKITLGSWWPGDEWKFWR